MVTAESSQQRETENQPQPGEPLFGRTMSAFSWRFVSELSKFILQMTVMILLARLIHVDQFGLLALAMVVINLVVRISEGGIYYAVIQRKELTEAHIRVAFTLSVLFGLFFTACVYFGAPLAGKILRNDEVVPILRLISVTFLFMNFGSTALGLLQRKLDYQSLLRVELISYISGYILVSIVLALLGYGVWALAWASVIQSLLKTILLYWASRHPLRLSLASSETRDLFSFGAGSTLSTLANYAAINGDYFIVGRWLGTTALGLYSRAYQIMTLPLYQTTSVINSVLFPVYSMIQAEDSRLRRAYLLSLSLSSIVVSPVLAGMGVAAPEIMSGVFGKEWVGAAPPLQVLCFAGIFVAIYSLGDSLARAKGAVYQKFICHAIYAVCVFAGAYIGTRWGITHVALGVTAAILVMYLLMARLTVKLTELSWKQYFLCQIPGMAIGAGVVLVAYPITKLLRTTSSPDLVILAGTIFSSGIAAIAVGLLLPRGWVNKVTFGAVDKLEQMTGTAGQQIRKFLRRHKFAYKIAYVPYVWYETALFFSHLSRQGLWRSLLEPRRSNLLRTTQTEIKWRVPFPDFERSDELIEWIRSQGMTVKEGAHTFYLPPQKGLVDLIPGIVNFYPKSAGFKLLRNFDHPKLAKYLVEEHEAYYFYNRLIVPRKLMVSANYMHLLGIGPRIWDLACWTGKNINYTVFVVEHISGDLPTEEQCNTFLIRLKDINNKSHLRILLPDWQRSRDFNPPNCHDNLIYSSKLGRLQYIDFQNFGFTRIDAWSKEIISMANGSLSSNGSITLERGENGLPGASNSYVRKRWIYILEQFRNSSLSFRGRIVLDIGCRSGVILHSALAAGAFWGFGWDRYEAIEITRDLLFSFGTTRFSLTGANLHHEYRLEDDIPLRFQAVLKESVVFHLSISKETGAIESLRTIPWRVLVYEGHEAETLENIRDSLMPFLSSNVSIIASSYLTDDNGRNRPICIFLRS